ncbi:MAG: response regulator transcription factor [Rhodoferax sp.]|uniref:response regulator transcription factor n=1 Tax=Rhodoferax sp. TaxID=50421 RepID=UPI00301B12E6
MICTTPAKLRVFLVEDTADLREEIVFGLTALGLDVSGFGDAIGLYRALAVKSCDIVVIDVGLPGEDGFSIAQHLRNNPTLGIVFLTARATLDDRLHGLGMGADAYLVKPIDVRELAATLRAVDRRLFGKPETTLVASLAAKGSPSAPVTACWSLSADDWVLRNPQGCELTVTDTERRFLKIMVASAGQVVERETLIDAFAQIVSDYDPHRLDALVSRLRKRTEMAGLGSLPLQSIRGTGYVFSVQDRRFFSRDDI